MASYIFSLIGTGGDIYPCIPVARELVARGHKVTVLASSYFKHVFEKESLAYVPIGDENVYLESISDPRYWANNDDEGILWGLRTDVGQSIMPTYRIIESMREEAPIVIACLNSYGADFAARELGLKIYYLGYAPFSLVNEDRFPFPLNRSIYQLLPRPLRRALVRRSRRLGDRLVVPELNAWRKNIGLPPLAHYCETYKLGNMLAFFPHWFDDLSAFESDAIYQGDFVFYHSDETKSLPGSLEQFLAKGDPPLVFTFGTGIAHVRKYYEIALEALRGTQYRAIFLSRFSQNLPISLPENVIGMDYVDLASLLPRTALLVHHGGIGTTAQAMRAGVPQIIMPVAFDQPDNGFRIRQLGLGDMIRGKELGPKALHKAFSRVISKKNQLLLDETRARILGSSGEYLIAQICEKLA